jgi:hypothetical protein
VGLLKWLFDSKPKEPVQSFVKQNVLYMKYKTIYDHEFEIAIYPDTKVPGTFTIKSNGLEVGRVGVSDDGACLIVSGTLRPIKYID